MGRAARWLVKVTRRIVYRQVMVYGLCTEWRFVPQWWFLWWHCYWREIGYEYYIPEGFEAFGDAQAFLAGRGVANFKEPTWRG